MIETIRVKCDIRYLWNDEIHSLISFLLGPGSCRAFGVHMKDWAEQFYNSPAWKQTRVAYSKSVGGLCERCLKKGIYRAGEIVHHRKWLTKENINEPETALSWSNLELLCRDHHAQEHSGREKRWKVDENGKVRDNDSYRVPGELSGLPAEAPPVEVRRQA